MNVLPLTLIFVDTVPARIYLSLLLKNGFKPNKIIRLVQAPRGRKGQILSRLLGRRFARYSISIIKKTKDVLSSESELNDMRRTLLSDFGLTNADLRDCFRSYEKNELEDIYCKDINDGFLKQKLQNEDNRTFLFSGGGILSAQILAIPGAKFIHIHPGIVPDIRGADCFFWSYLVRRRLGYSIFYMNEGIDTGDILFTKEFSVPSLKLKRNTLNSSQIKNLILTYYDPCLRIMTLIEMLSTISMQGSINSNKLSSLPSIKQDNNQGRMYFFMHELLIDKVIEKLIGVQSE
ncbi:formyltransferase family protein [Pseudidiomarina taiwanensis]|uniref:Formyl transferase N-terminal domain-containing protein n=1 Tax=Pseudidiomarina taiwanensis TaxID=337250 RepID=A0A432ZKG8_9GAMM|nr:formyltransferase family protein [Pseudidiomarina taiwanensis]RUO78403.1 hypothetical protein CWI83_05075 [Pseudidiomarina taiwanensis]